MHEPIPPTVNERGDEEHPAFGMVRVARLTGGRGVLFDSDITHNQVVRLSVQPATRKWDLHRDWIHSVSKTLIEIDMSEAQWAGLVSSFNTEGVSCTIRATETNYDVPGLELESRLAISAAETRDAAEKALERIRAAYAAVAEKPTKANIRSLGLAIDQAPGSMKFAADSLTEHTENVVQKARADIEAMVDSRARAVGIDPQIALMGDPFAGPAQIEAAPPPYVPLDDAPTREQEGEL